MKTAAEIADQAIEKMDHEDANPGADDSKKADDPKGGSDDSKKTDDKKDDGAANAAGDDSKVGTDDKGTGDEEGKFTADDALEVETPKVDTPPAAPTDSAGVQLSPAEQKYIVDNIGEALVIKGVRGEGDQAKEVELKVFSPHEIPADFKFANDAQMMAAQTGFQRLETRAQSLLGNFRNQQTQSEQADFEHRENEGIRLDVADLQKEGLFPKFKIQPGAEGFDNSAEAKQMAEVLNIMTSKNEQYFKEYQQGRPYRHIGFREAFADWQGKQNVKKVDDAQKQEDADRKELAPRVGSNRGLTAEGVVKPTVPAGTTIDQILARHEND